MASIPASTKFKGLIMSNVITLKKLNTEGRLSIGDILHHNENGDHELVFVRDDKRITVKDTSGKYFTWTIDFGPDTRIVPIK